MIEFVVHRPKPISTITTSIINLQGPPHLGDKLQETRRSSDIAAVSSYELTKMSHFPFRGSPNIQTSVSTTPPTPPPASAPMAVTTSVPARSSSPCSAASGPPNSRCCDTGRPLFTDPITGQSVCSCQYDLMGYQRLAGLPGGMPALSMYSNAYPDGFPAYLPALGAEQAPFYPSPAGALDLKENLAAAGGAPWPYPAVYPYEAAFAGYPFNGYGMDLNGARRKNATRETTSTLKAWLNEHKKNPYPTKGEKIMLAIITKMTLTQVSTWFANARRRLKKENKMTWEPRNRVDDDDANLDDDDDHKSTDGKDLLDSKDSGTGSSEDGDRPSNRLDMLDRADRGGDGRDSEWSESRPGSGPGSPEMFDRPPMGHPHPLLHPAALHHFRPPMGHPADALLHHHNLQQQHHLAGQALSSAGASTNTTNVINKPRIWSLADMASKETSSNGSSNKEESGHNSNNNNQHSNSNGRPYSPNGGGGKIVSPLAGRLPIHGSPYIRPEFYRNFYQQGGPNNGNTSAEAALLESYQRTFGGLGPNGLPMHHPLNTMISKVTAAGPHHFTPLSLTTSGAAAAAAAAAAQQNHANSSSNSHHNANAGGVSPSASSTSSIAETPMNLGGESKCSNSNGSSASGRSAIDVVSKP